MRCRGDCTSAKASGRLAATLGVSRKTVRRYRVWATTHHLLTGPVPDAGRLQAVLAETAPAVTLPTTPFRAAPYRARILALRAQGVERRAILERLREVVAVNVSSPARWALVQCFPSRKRWPRRARNFRTPCLDHRNSRWIVSRQRTQEPLGAQDGGELGADDLDRDLPLVLEVLGEVHRGHAARAEFAFDAVAVSQCRGESVEEIDHGRAQLRSGHRGGSARGSCRPAAGLTRWHPVGTIRRVLHHHRAPYRRSHVCRRERHPRD